LAGVAPMAKLPAGIGVLLEAVNEMDSVVPSGRLKEYLIWSPGLGLPAVMSTDTAAGEPDGPVTTALVNDDDTEFSLNPNGEPATSSATFTEVVAGAEITRRPSPPEPRSACWRSEISCFSPALPGVPLRMSSAEATAGVPMALPEKI